MIINCYEDGSLTMEKSNKEEIVQDIPLSVAMIKTKIIDSDGISMDIEYEPK